MSVGARLISAQGERMGELEAVGDAVTGGLAGRAVEPDAGEADGHTHEKSCLNCGCKLLGDYCHCCGQKAHVHRTLRAFWHDLLHGALHFEGKIWRTLPLLIWKPGKLTRQYIDGRRASYVSPVALFLFTVFLMFAVMGLTGTLDGAAGGVAPNELASEVTKVRQTVAELEADRARAIREGKPTAKIDDRLVDARAELTALSVMKGGKIDPSVVRASDDTPGWLGGFIDNASANPELLFYKLKTNAYKFSWALIPISVPFVWLLFPFSRRFKLYDHTVFVTYSLCFMMLLLIAGSTLGLIWPTIASLLFFVPPFHMYRQLKGTYGLSRWGALWRVTLLIGFAFAAIGMFTALVVGMGAVD